MTAISDGALSRLEPLVAAYVTEVALERETLRLAFDPGITLRVANEELTDPSRVPFGKKHAGWASVHECHPSI